MNVYLMSSSTLHAIPISSRPATGLRQRLLGLTSAVLFNFGIILIHGSQFLVLIPLRLLIVLVPVPLFKRLHEAGVRWTKGSFARLLGQHFRVANESTLMFGPVLVCQWFSPTRMLVSFEGENLREEDVVIRDSSGRVTKLNLPEKLVLIANHQVWVMSIMRSESFIYLMS